MFANGFKVRVIALREEEDWQARDSIIEAEILKQKPPHKKEDYERIIAKHPIPMKLRAEVAVYNQDGERCGSFDLDVTDRRNVLFIGQEVKIEWA